MSKCHPPATMIQISYFLPSCLSLRFSPPPPSPFSSVCCLKAPNEIHTDKMGGRMLSSSPSLTCFISGCFSFIFPVVPFPCLYCLPSVLHTLLHLLFLTYFSMRAVFSFQSHSFISVVCVYSCHLFPSSLHFILEFFNVSVPAGPIWKHIGYLSSYLYIQQFQCVFVCVCAHLLDNSLH